MEEAYPDYDVNTVSADTDEEQKVKETIQRRRHFSDKRREWHNEALKDLNYYTLRQWTKDQQRELEARGQAPLVVDRITPAIKQLTAILTAKAPIFRTVAVTDDDVKMAQMFSDIIQYIWYDNDGNEIAAKWIQDMLIYGVGYLYWYYDEVSEDGKPKIAFDRLHPFDVYVDPESRKEDLSDASSIIFSKMITKERALVLFPDYADQIKKILPDGEDDKMYADLGLHTEERIRLLDEITDENKKKIRYYEEYIKKRVNFTAFIDTLTGEVKELCPKKAEKFAQDEEIAKAIEAGEIQTVTVPKIRVLKRQILGNILLKEELLPTSIYPIIPLFYDHHENPYGVGAIRGLRGLQDEINHRRSLMIAHAASSTNAKLLYLKGTFDDEEDIEQIWSRPSAAIAVNPVGGQRISDSIMTPGPMPLPSALYQLEAEAKYDIEYNIGLFAMSHGDAKSAPTTFRATLAIEEFGSRRHALYARKIGYALRRAGKLCIDFIQNYMTVMDVMRLVEPASTTLEQKEGRSINWPIFDSYGNEIEKVNDLSVGKYDVMVVEGSTLPSNRMALLEMYMELYKLNAIDRVELWKKTDVLDREGLMQRFSEIGQLQAQVAQLNEQLKKLSSDNVRLRQKLLTAEIDAELQKQKVRLNEAEVGYKDEARRAIAELKNQSVEGPENVGEENPEEL